MAEAGVALVAAAALHLALLRCCPLRCQRLAACEAAAAMQQQLAVAMSRLGRQMEKGSCPAAVKQGQTTRVRASRAAEAAAAGEGAALWR